MWGAVVGRWVVRGRWIFVSTKAAGLSEAFHNDKEIGSLFNVLKPNSTHASFTDMTPTTKKWIVDNMQYVALQLFDAKGNIVIFCKNGRSRSPMYLVAYLIIFYGVSVHEAMHSINDMLVDQRGNNIG